jgi:hypothetical protein
MAARRKARIIARDEFCTIKPLASVLSIASILLKLFYGLLI